MVVLIAHTNRIFRELLERSLRLNTPEIRDVHIARNQLELSESVKYNRYDVLITHMELNAYNSIEGIVRSQSIHQPKKQILLVDAVDFKSINRAVQLDFNIFDCSEQNLEDLTELIVSDERELYAPQWLVKGMMKYREETEKREKEHHGLTPVLQELLTLICAGLTNAQIAELQGKSIRTIQGQRLELIQRTKTKNTIGLVVFAIENGLFEVNIKNKKK